MDVTSWLLEVAARRPHVLVVAVPGYAPARLALEAAIARRGWRAATAPADADILAVAGSAGPDLAAVVDRVWQQLPAPRARITVVEPGTVDGELDRAAVELSDRHHQRDDSSAALDHGDHGLHSEHAEHADGADHAGHQGHSGHHAHGARDGHTEHREHHPRDGGPRDDGDHEGHVGHQADGTRAQHDDRPAHGEDDHGSHQGRDGHADRPAAGHEHHGPPEADGGHDAHQDHGGDHSDPGHESDNGDHAGHAGHHGHGGGMEMPGGLPMADLGADRDGLTLDRLHLPLGPVLPDWPAGLVVRVTVQGDVIQVAAAEVLDAGHVPSSSWLRGDGVARELDGLARFLGVAGWDDAAAHARRLRDARLGGGAPADELAKPVAELVRRVRRSRTLRWLIRGIPAGPSDVAALLEARLGAIEAMLAVPDAPALPRTAVDDLPDLVVGAEFAAARLIIAAVDPETERSPVGQEVRGA